jgi:hypothetical protein
MIFVESPDPDTGAAPTTAVRSNRSASAVARSGLGKTVHEGAQVNRGVTQESIRRTKSRHHLWCRSLTKVLENQVSKRFLL